MHIRAIRSGGQTGADRGALDAARQAGVPIAGWCPKGGWAEDMTEPPGLMAPYPELVETPSADVIQRTEWNVRDSDATLIVCENGLAQSPGTLATIGFAKQMGKPCIVVGADGVAKGMEWLKAVAPADEAGIDLNIAGPRESGSPGTYALAKSVVGRVLVETETETESAGRCD